VYGQRQTRLHQNIITVVRLFAVVTSPTYSGPCVSVLRGPTRLVQAQKLRPPLPTAGTSLRDSLFRGHPKTRDRCHPIRTRDAVRLSSIVSLCYNIVPSFKSLYPSLCPSCSAVVCLSDSPSRLACYGPHTWSSTEN
jgi:hypothetical protein